jgi:hypothetical protein
MSFASKMKEVLLFFSVLLIFIITCIYIKRWYLDKTEGIITVQDDTKTDPNLDTTQRYANNQYYDTINTEIDALYEQLQTIFESCNYTTIPIDSITYDSTPGITIPKVSINLNSSNTCINPQDTDSFGMCNSIYMIPPLQSISFVMPKGPTGPTGPAGPNGVIGSTGPMGPTGPQGPGPVVSSKVML